LNSKRIVITGGPGSGKTSLIRYFEDLGHVCLPEISREVTFKAQQQGISQLFLEQPLLFSELLLNGRKAQFLEAPSPENTPFLFYDRGLPDVTAYMDYLGTEYPSFFTETCNNLRYDAIFLLPPWEEIYIQDNERYESYAQAERLFEFLHQAYQNYGYTVYHVPVGSIQYRGEYILKKIASLF